MRNFKILVIFLVCIWTPLFMGAFDKDKPSASTSLRSSNPEILANWSQIQTAENNEHIFSGTSAGTQTGDHTQGSARTFSQASAPATRIDAAGFLSTDLGSLWTDTDDNAVYVLTATVPTWTPISTEVIATLLASNRVFAGTLGVNGNFEVGTGSEFTVAAASGNVATSGTLDIQSTIPVVGVIDDDTMATATATNLVTGESIVAYVDNKDSMVKFNVTSGDSVSTTKSRNVTSVAGSGGSYTVTWDTDFSDGDYLVLAGIGPVSNTHIHIVTVSQAAGSVVIRTLNASGVAATPAVTVDIWVLAREI